MVLTADDIAVITHIVTTTMASMPMQQQAAAAPHPEGARRAVDERHYRKINIFNVTGWKDFSFQFKAATRSSHEVTFDLLCWAELEQSDIDPLDGYANYEVRVGRITLKICARSRLPRFVERQSRVDREWEDECTIAVHMLMGLDWTPLILQSHGDHTV